MPYLMSQRNCNPSLHHLLIASLVLIAVSCSRAERKSYRSPNGAEGPTPESEGPPLDLSVGVSESATTSAAPSATLNQAVLAAPPPPSTTGTGSPVWPLAMGMTRHVSAPVGGCTVMFLREDMALVSTRCLQSLSDASGNKPLADNGLRVHAVDSKATANKFLTSGVASRYDFKNYLTLLKLQNRFTFASGALPDMSSTLVNGAACTTLTTAAQQATPRYVQTYSAASNFQDAFDCNFAVTRAPVLANSSSFASILGKGISELRLAPTNTLKLDQLIAPEVTSNVVPTWLLGGVIDAGKSLLSHTCDLDLINALKLYLKYEPLAPPTPTLAAANACNSVTISLDKTPAVDSKGPLGAALRVTNNTGWTKVTKATIKHGDAGPVTNLTGCANNILTGSNKICMFMFIFPFIREGQATNANVTVFLQDESGQQYSVSKSLFVPRNPPIRLPKLTITPITIPDVAPKATTRVIYEVSNTGEDTALAVTPSVGGVITTPRSPWVRTPTIVVSASTCKAATPLFRGSKCLVAVDIPWQVDNGVSDITTSGSLTINFRDDSLDASQPPLSTNITLSYKSLKRIAQMNALVTSPLPTEKLLIRGTPLVKVVVSNGGNLALDNPQASDVSFTIDGTKTDAAAIVKSFDPSDCANKSLQPTTPPAAPASCTLTWSLKWPGDGKKIGLTGKLQATSELGNASQPFSVAVVADSIADKVTFAVDSATKMVSFGSKGKFTYTVKNTADPADNITITNIAPAVIGVPGGISPTSGCQNSTLSGGQSCQFDLTVPWQGSAATIQPDVKISMKASSAANGVTNYTIEKTLKVSVISESVDLSFGWVSTPSPLPTLLPYPAVSSSVLAEIKFTNINKDNTTFVIKNLKIIDNPRYTVTCPMPYTVAKSAFCTIKVPLFWTDPGTSSTAAFTVEADVVAQADPSFTAKMSKTFSYAKKPVDKVDLMKKVTVAMYGPTSPIEFGSTGAYTFKVTNTSATGDNIYITNFSEPKFSNTPTGFSHLPTCSKALLNKGDSCVTIAYLPWQQTTASNTFTYSMNATYMIGEYPIPIDLGPVTATYSFRTLRESFTLAPSTKPIPVLIPYPAKTTTVPLQLTTLGAVPYKVTPSIVGKPAGIATPTLTTDCPSYNLVRSSPTATCAINTVFNWRDPKQSAALTQTFDVLFTVEAQTPAKSTGTYNETFSYTLQPLDLNDVYKKISVTVDKPTASIPFGGSTDFTYTIRNAANPTDGITIAGFSDALLTPFPTGTVTSTTCRDKTLNVTEICTYKVTIPWQSIPATQTFQFAMDLDFKFGDNSARIRVPGVAASFTSEDAQKMLVWKPTPKPVTQIKPYPVTPTKVSLSFTNTSVTTINVTPKLDTTLSKVAPPTMDQSCTTLKKDETCNMTLTFLWGGPKEGTKDIPYKISVDVKSATTPGSTASLSETFTYTLLPIDLSDAYKKISLTVDKPTAAIQFGQVVDYTYKVRNVGALGDGITLSGLGDAVLTGAPSDVKVVNNCATSTLNVGDSCTYVVTVPWQKDPATKSYQLAVPLKFAFGTNAVSIQPPGTSASYTSEDLTKSLTWGPTPKPEPSIKPYPARPTKVALSFTNNSLADITLAPQLVINPGTIAPPSLDFTCTSLKPKETCNFSTIFSWIDPIVTKNQTFQINMDVVANTPTGSKSTVGSSYSYVVNAIDLADMNKRVSVTVDKPTSVIPFGQSVDYTFTVKNGAPQDEGITLSGLGDAVLTPAPNGAKVTNNCATATLNGGDSCTYVVTVPWQTDPTTKSYQLNVPLKFNFGSTVVPIQVPGASASYSPEDLTKIFSMGIKPKPTPTIKPYPATTIVVPLPVTNLSLTEVILKPQLVITPGTVAPPTLEFPCTRLKSRETCSGNLVFSWINPNVTKNQTFQINIEMVANTSTVSKATLSDSYSYTVSALDMNEVSRFVDLSYNQTDVILPFGADNTNFSFGLKNLSNSEYNISIGALTPNLSDPAIPITTQCSGASLKSGDSCSYAFSVPWDDSSPKKAFRFAVNPTFNFGSTSLQVPKSTPFTVTSVTAEESLSVTASSTPTIQPEGSASVTLSLQNIGKNAMNIAGVDIPGFTFKNNCASASLAPSQICTLVVPITWIPPGNVTNRSYTVAIDVQSATQRRIARRITKTYSYNLVKPDLNLTLSFDNTEPVAVLREFGSLDFTLTNIGNVTAALSQIFPNDNGSTTLESVCSQLKPGGTCRGKVTMTNLTPWVEQILPIKIRYVFPVASLTKDIYAEKRVYYEAGVASLDIKFATQNLQCLADGIAFSTKIQLLNTGSAPAKNIKYYYADEANLNQRWEATPLSGLSPCRELDKGATCDTEIRINDPNGLPNLVDANAVIIAEFDDGKTRVEKTIPTEVPDFPVDITPNDSFTQEIGMNSYAPQLVLSNRTLCPVQIADIKLAEWAYITNQDTGEESWQSRPKLQGDSFGGSTRLDPGQAIPINLPLGQFSPDFTKVKFEVAGWLNGVQLASERSAIAIGLKRSVSKALTMAANVSDVSRPSGSAFLQSIDTSAAAASVSSAVGLDGGQLDVLSQNAMNGTTVRIPIGTPASAVANAVASAVVSPMGLSSPLTAIAVPTSGAWIPVTLTAEGDQFIGRMRAIQPLPLVDAANMWLQLGSVQDDRCRDASIRHPSFTRVDLPTACTYSVFVPYNYDYGGLTRVGILEAKFQDESWNWHSYKAKFNLIYVPRPDKIAIKRLLPQDPVHLTSGVKQTFRYEIVNTTSLTIFPKQHRLGVGGWQDIPWCAVLGPGARCEVNFDITDNTAEVRNVMAEYQVRYEIDNNVSYWSDILNVEYILSPPSQSFLNLDLTLCSRSNRLMRYDRSFQMKFKFSDNGELTQTKQFFVDPACRKPFSKAQNSAFMKSDISLFKWLEDLTEPSKISAKYQLTNRREYPGTKDILYDLDITWQAPGTNTDSSRFNFQDYLLLRENGEVRISTSYCYGAQPKACLIGLSEVNTVRAAPGILYFEPWFLVLGYSKPETTSN